MREAAAGWLARRHGVTVSPDAVLPVIGTKEFIAWLPTMLGCGAGDTVVYPALADPSRRGHAGAVSSPEAGPDAGSGMAGWASSGCSPACPRRSDTSCSRAEIRTSRSVTARAMASSASSVMRML